ncbi:Mis12-Mtw1 protein family-domain-containing protein [Podospora fimiseda]|uniref:Mis12-Mtw1 protein family-domain-containing protein n=1 Tax=Podospora fimiseda TaxID=252190 RepID=A0AAN7BKD1_9PEZI|nr:Mis12-Mtw1 protein family-domain-containing protein [Podospora fimiseda]
MTTLVRTRQPLQVLSMSNLPERRSKRLAACALLTNTIAPAVYDEQDGDFLFTRGSKRVKTTAAAPEPEPEPVQETPPPPPGRRAGRPPKNSSIKRVASSPPPPPAPEPKIAKVAATPATTRRTSRRKSSLAAPPVQDEEPVLPKPKGRRKGRESAADKKLRLEQEEEAEAQAQLMNGIPEEEEEEGEEQPPPPPLPPLPKPKAKPGRRSTQRQQQQQEEEQPTPPQAPQTIALPFSDTPIQNRNKEFRKKGGNTGGRRSSLGLRGRRASSLIDNGQTALPHKTVDPSEFWKYISAEGLSEPRRMKQLLIWCGERALSAKPRGNSAGGSKGNSAVLGARAIQDQILKDFGSVSEFSDWFSREDDESVEEKKKRPAKPIKLEPNPINVQNDEKIAALEARIARLKSLKQSWTSLLSCPLPTIPPINHQDSSSSSPSSIPDPKYLSEKETEILNFLTNPQTNFGGFKRQVRTRLQNLQGDLEYEVDLLGDRIHKFDMRVGTAEREAEAVLRVCSERLREREQKEKKRVGTGGLSVFEVLRSLGRVVGGGEGG